MDRGRPDERRARERGQRPLLPVAPGQGRSGQEQAAQGNDGDSQHAGPLVTDREAAAVQAVRGAWAGGASP